jgi:hypothetical protein
VTVSVSSRVLVFLPAALLAGAVVGFSSAEVSTAAVAGADALPGEVLSAEGTETSGVSKPADGASAARVSTVIIVAAISS